MLLVESSLPWAMLARSFGERLKGGSMGHNYIGHTYIGHDCIWRARLASGSRAAAWAITT